VSIKILDGCRLSALKTLSKWEVYDWLSGINSISNFSNHSYPVSKGEENIVEICV